MGDQVNRMDRWFGCALLHLELASAAFGNAREPYFNYKRTGYPSLQSPILASGSFPRTFRYPADEITANPNIIQNSPTKQVFWDNNAPGFID